MLNISLILRTFTPCISCCDVLFHSFRTWDCLKTGEIANGGDFGAKSSRVGPETPPVRRTSTDSSTGCCRRPAEIKKERLIIFPMGGLHAYVVCHTVTRKPQEYDVLNTAVMVIHRNYDRYFTGPQNPIPRKKPPISRPGRGES